MSEASASVKQPKALALASEAAAGWPSVRAFLHKHPDLVQQDGELLERLNLKIGGPGVVDFGPAALARQIEAMRKETAARQALEANARANFAAQAQCHAAVLDLLDARHPADLARRLDETARGRFGLLTGVLVVEGRAPGGWVGLEGGMVETIIGGPGPSRLGASDYAPMIFPKAPEPVASCALIRLSLWRVARPGLLALASTDADAFAPDMGSDLIGFLARVLERTADRWPPI